MCVGHTAGGGENAWPGRKDCGVEEEFAWAERPEGDGRLAWVGDGGCVPGTAERAKDWGGGEDPGAETPDSGPGYSRETLARGPGPLPNPLVLKSPGHLRLQEGKEPEKRIVDHMDLFPRFFFFFFNTSN